MATTLKATFETRRDAEMTVERLVQEKGIERSDIFVSADGPANTAGDVVAGSDDASAAPSAAERNDGAHNGPIEVSVDLQDDAKAADVKAAFAEFDAANVET